MDGCLDHLIPAILMGLKKIQLAVKNCKRCGRPFHNRKKWIIRGIWEQIIYCSENVAGKKAREKSGFSNSVVDQTGYSYIR